MKVARVLRGDRSLREMEEETGLDHSTIGKIENGGEVRLKTARLLANHYGVTVDELLKDVPEPTGAHQ